MKEEEYEREKKKKEEVRTRTSIERKTHVWHMSHLLYVLILALLFKNVANKTYNINIGRLRIDI